MFKRFVLPILAIISCVFMVFCAIMGHGVFPYLEAAEQGKFVFPVLFYLIVFALIMFIGFILNLKNKKIEKVDKENEVENKEL